MANSRGHLLRVRDVLPPREPGGELPCWPHCTARNVGSGLEQAAPPASALTLTSHVVFPPYVSVPIPPFRKDPGLTGRGPTSCQRPNHTGCALLHTRPHSEVQGAGRRVRGFWRLALPPTTSPRHPCARQGPAGDGDPARFLLDSWVGGTWHGRGVREGRGCGCAGQAVSQGGPHGDHRC